MSDTNGSQVSALSSLASIIIPCCGMLGRGRLLMEEI
jgi:hypothetical protein